MLHINAYTYIVSMLQCLWRVNYFNDSVCLVCDPQNIFLPIRFPFLLNKFIIFGSTTPFTYDSQPLPPPSTSSTKKTNVSFFIEANFYATITWYDHLRTVICHTCEINFYALRIAPTIGCLKVWHDLYH